MGSITYCDLCTKKQKSEKEDWLTVTLYGHGEETVKQIGRHGIGHYDLCPSCTKKVLKPLLDVLKKKK
ncbi:MAG: hypothetical protein KBD29_01460 [Candidatus Magasanikbacteria bacterium]|nr:hypothetical protein [Candidatus Magasanikbacteria bacterium]